MIESHFETPSHTVNDIPLLAPWLVEKLQKNGVKHMFPGKIIYFPHYPFSICDTTSDLESVASIEKVFLLKMFSSEPDQNSELLWSSFEQNFLLNGDCLFFHFCWQSNVQ